MYFVFFRDSLPRGPFPRESDALFRLVAEIGNFLSGIKAFTAAFADLRAGVELWTTDNSGDLFFCFRSGPRSNDWAELQREFQLMGRIVQLWDFIRTGDDNNLSKHFFWRSEAGKIGVHYVNKPGGKTKVIASMDQNPEVLERFKPGDLREPAMFYILSVINEKLDALAPRVCGNLENQKVTLHLIPPNLLGGLWLQFAQAVARNPNYERCKVCETWFEVSLQASRKSRLYCSDSCKVRAHLKRKEDARRMHSQGKTLEIISTELGSDKNKILKWIEIKGGRIT